MRIKSIALLSFVIAVSSGEASAECWPSGQTTDRSAAELVACFLSEIQSCEETSPDFKAKSSAGLVKFKSDPRFIEISKSKDFDKIKKETYLNLKSRPMSQGGCNSVLNSLQSGQF